MNLNGKRFGRLVVVGAEGVKLKKGSSRYWECLCDCGSTKFVRQDHLIKGKIVSCKCFWKQRLVDRAKHGAARSGRWTPEYKIWMGMLSRCNNPNRKAYPTYGGRGIKVCDRWRDFENFLSDMGPRPSPVHSIDRLNPNGNYEPGNCRWATSKEQGSTRRDNRRIKYRGSEIMLSELVRASGVPHATLSRYLDQGLSAEQAIEKYHAKHKEAH